MAFEIVEWQRAYAPALAIPDGATDDARRGATWYGDRCIRCHKMRGVGGDRGPDLTTVAGRIGAVPFTAHLERHPGWAETAVEPPGPLGAQELWSFLRAAAASPAPAPPEPVTADRATR